MVRDQGTTVPVIVNGRAVGRGRDHPLTTGDELRIAGYALRVETAESARVDVNVSADDTTTILREGTLLSWSEDGAAVPDDRIATVIVPSPETEAEEGAPAPAVPAPVTAPAAGSAAAGSGTAIGAVEVAGPSATSTDALLAALLRGAGVRDLAIPGGLTPQFMEELGAVMRETLRGLLDLLAARAHAKREVRADATIIVAQDNNPLKFSPGLDAAISASAHAARPGLHAAVAQPRRRPRSACARTRKASWPECAPRWRQCWRGSTPRKLEERLTESADGGSLLPMNHKAKLWNLYEELYEQISREAETDFHFLFGEEFLRAYQAKARPLPSPGMTNGAS